MHICAVRSVDNYGACIVVRFRSWQQTSRCYKTLMKQCNGDRDAVQELSMHVGRYWVYSLSCADSRDVITTGEWLYDVITTMSSCDVVTTGE